MNTYVTHATKHFPGGYTTATILATGATYRVTVITRFHSGNYLTEVDESGLTLTKAREFMCAYTY